MKQENNSKKRTSLHMTRRSFLWTAVAVPFTAAIVGCRKKSITHPRVADMMKSVAVYHRNHGELPPNPVAIAWDHNIGFYPPIKESEHFSDEHSHVYSLVARALMLLNPDNLENPLVGIVHPGDTVVIKPNWCTQHLFPFPITHPSVVFPLVEFALKAGAARVNIVEAPMTMQRGCDWFWSSAFVGAHAMTKILSAHHNEAEVKFIDGNNDEFIWIDVGEASELKTCLLEQLDHDGHTGFGHNIFFDVADYRGYNPRKYRQGLAAIARSYLDCDVFINVPKLKTHGYTGITCAIKNLMGLTLASTIHKMDPELLARYKSLPNFALYRESPMRDIPHIDRTKLRSVTKKEYLYHIGPGNDILWRTLADLNKIIRYATRDGMLKETPQRRYLTIVDGVVGTDKNGPISDSLVHTQCIVAGHDPVRVDAICTYLMGWDPLVLNLVTNCSASTLLPFGTADQYLDSIVGVELDSPCFDHRFVPPGSYREDIIAPQKLLRV